MYKSESEENGTFSTISGFKVRLRVHDKVLSTSPRSGETQRLTTCDLIHSMTTKSGRQVVYITIRPCINLCHTKSKVENGFWYCSN